MIVNVKHYKAIIKKIDWNTIIIVATIALIVGVLSILHVIIAFAHTKPGMTYFWTGHYYLDFFYYLSFIAQGQRGNFLAFSQFATDDPSVYFQWFPYIAIGQLSRPFQISAMAAYWFAVFLFTTATVVIMYVIIDKIIQHERFILKILTLLLTLSMTPFFSVVPSGIIYHDFWSSYSTFFRRFEPIPHHLFGTLIILTGLLLLSRLIDRLHTCSYNELLKHSIIFVFTCTIGLMFYPFQTIILTLTVGLTGGFYLFAFVAIREPRMFKKLLLFLLFTGFSVVSATLIIRSLYSPMFLANFKEVETKIHQNLSIGLFILTTGPSIGFMLFGLRKYFENPNNLKIILLSFFFASYLLFFSPLDQYLGTHNGRFLSPVNYLFLGVLTTLGIKQIAELFRRYNFIVIVSAFILLFICSTLVNIQAFINILNDKNLSSPISYLPNGVVEAMKYPDTRSEKGNVLMTPSQFLGTVLPAFSGRKTYIARHIATPNYLEKNIRTSNFYLGAMSQEEAIEFLRKNDLKFVIWTSIEGYDLKPLYHYSFLKEVYKNTDAIVFLVKEI